MITNVCQAKICNRYMYFGGRCVRLDNWHVNLDNCIALKFTYTNEVDLRFRLIYVDDKLYHCVIFAPYQYELVQFICKSELLCVIMNELSEFISNI